MFLVFILFALVFGNHYGTSNDIQHVLALSGPVDACEGDEVEFTVTLDGEPVQARVTFGDVVPVASSNGSTGIVNFTMPAVPYNGRWYTVTASMPSELYATHHIFVKNTTGALQIELPGQPVVEMEDFRVAITDRGVPVSGASVWFSSSMFRTNSSGEVTVTAPDVLVSAAFGIFVNKTGYKSNSTMVTVTESGVGEQLMEVLTPYIVEPGRDNIEVRVIDKHGALEGVLLEVYYEGEQQAEYLTDSHGEASIAAPFIHNDNYFSLYATKEGYNTFEGDGEITVSLVAHEAAVDLDIRTSSEVDEGDLVTVEVTDSSGSPVEGCMVWKGSVAVADVTDAEGIVTFAAPLVFMDREVFLYALKEGYNFAEEQITIRNKGGNGKTLIVDVDNPVNETTVFQVTVKDANHLPVYDAIVVFNSVEELTDEEGTASFVAPNVTSDTFYTLQVTKEGYQPASVTFEVINSDGSNGASSRQLFICVAPTISENADFTITIRKSDSSVVSGAQVKFMGTYKTTDYKGEVAFTAPDVYWDTTESILVTKSGCQSASASLLVKNTSEFPYWFFVIACVIILIIGIAAYFRYRQYMI